MSQPTGAPAPQTRSGDSDPDMDEALYRVRTTRRRLTSYKRRDVRNTMSRVLGR